MPSFRRPMLVRSLFLGAALASSAPALAQPGWGGPGWGRPADGWEQPTSSRDPREGKVEATRFVAEGAATALGHGRIAVHADSGGTADEREQATYEAAVIDQLAHAGYDTATPDPDGGQIADLHIIHEVVVPEEAPHRPISGEVAMGASNRGSMMGMAVNIDLTKPKKALISTRLEARIRDRASGTVLWEAHAEIVTREGDGHWGEQAIATRLAAAMFGHFPGRSGETVDAR